MQMIKKHKLHLSWIFCGPQVAVFVEGQIIMLKTLTDGTGYLLAMHYPWYPFEISIRDDEYMYDEIPVHSGTKEDRRNFRKIKFSVDVKIHQVGSEYCLKPKNSLFKFSALSALSHHRLRLGRYITPWKFSSFFIHAFNSKFGSARSSVKSS